MTIEIQTKSSLGDTVFFIKDNKIQFGVIYKIEITIDGETQNIHLYTRGNANEVSFLSEIKTFLSREELIESL